MPHIFRSFPIILVISVWLYKIIIVNDRFFDNIEEYIGQGWEITAVNFIPSGSSVRYGPFFRIGLSFDELPD